MAGKDETRRKSVIVTTRYSNYLVADLEVLKKSDGTILKTDPVTALCRCGQSGMKPYCDGTHNEKGLNENKKKDRVKDKVKKYVGKEITIYDNRGVCSHDGSCIRLLPNVFVKEQKPPWINPDGGSVKEIIETIEKCPSGALSYGFGSRRYQDLEQEPAIQTSKNGPLKIMGGIELKDDLGSRPECAEHYTLCRCGQSRNKPFCDGSHLDHDFKAD